jgi:hypothetical protein
MFSKERNKHDRKSAPLLRRSLPTSEVRDDASRVDFKVYDGPRAVVSDWVLKICVADLVFAVIVVAIAAALLGAFMLLS